MYGWYPGLAAEDEILVPRMDIQMDERPQSWVKEMSLGHSHVEAEAVDLGWSQSDGTWTSEPGRLHVVTVCALAVQ